MVRTTDGGIHRFDLHLDLADVSAELDMHLLELLLLGSLRDPRDGGEALLLAPPRVRLALEPRSGRTPHQLRVAALLPPLEARPAAATFVAARPELEAALGRGEAAVRHAQLHYVCLALHVLREHGALRGFFRGADVTVLKAFPTNAIGFLALAKAKWLLGVEDDERGAV